LYFILLTIAQALFISVLVRHKIKLYLGSQHFDVRFFAHRLYPEEGSYTRSACLYRVKTQSASLTPHLHVAHQLPSLGLLKL